MEIVDFYKSGAQVVVRTEASDMTHSFTASTDGGEDVQIGYVPAGRAKPVSGAAHDIIEHEGERYLLLKEGHVYDVTIVAGDAISSDVVSAEHGHLSLPIPAAAEVEVVEHDDADERDADERDADEGKLGDETTDEVADEQPESTEDDA